MSEVKVNVKELALKSTAIVLSTLESSDTPEMHRLIEMGMPHIVKTLAEVTGADEETVVDISKITGIVMVMLIHIMDNDLIWDDIREAFDEL